MKSWRMNWPTDGQTSCRDTRMHYKKRSYQSRSFLLKTIDFQFLLRKRYGRTDLHDLSSNLRRIFNLLSQSFGEYFSPSELFRVVHGELGRVLFERGIVTTLNAVFLSILTEHFVGVPAVDAGSVGPGQICASKAWRVKLTLRKMKRADFRSDTFQSV